MPADVDRTSRLMGDMPGVRSGRVLLALDDEVLGIDRHAGEIVNALGPALELQMYEFVAVVVAYRPAREIQLDGSAVVVAENQMAFAVRLFGLERRIVRHVQCQIGPGRVGPLVVAGDLENRVATQVDNTRAGRAGTSVLDHRCARNYCACLVLHRERDMRAVETCEPLWEPKLNHPEWLKKPFPSTRMSAVPPLLPTLMFFTEFHSPFPPIERSPVCAAPSGKYVIIVPSVMVNLPFPSIRSTPRPSLLRPIHRAPESTDTWPSPVTCM